VLENRPLIVCIGKETLEHVPCIRSQTSVLGRTSTYSDHD
jgi:hypothetical protein